MAENTGRYDDDDILASVGNADSQPKRRDAGEREKGLLVSALGFALSLSRAQFGPGFRSRMRRHSGAHATRPVLRICWKIRLGLLITP